MIESLRDMALSVTGYIIIALTRMWPISEVVVDAPPH